ncbi:MAG: hypothetical protein SGI99_06695 [Pseudomonadota bacterium]|nr:hypothetical protein [Pseudomonadota bacterium]
MIVFRPARLLGLALISLIVFAVAPASADDVGARSELIGLWQKMFASRDLAFQVTSSITTGKDKPIRSVMRVQWPNRFHMKTDQSEMIILPGGTWMNADGNWMKLPIDMQKLIAQFTPEMMQQSLDATKNVRFVGLETVNGKPVKVYTYDFDGKVMGIHSSGTAKVFLSIVDGYPLRIETTGTAMRKTTTTIAEYEYDNSIRIEAP